MHFILACMSALAADTELAPAPEDIDIDDALEKIRMKHPELSCDQAIELVELLVDRELTAEEGVRCRSKYAPRC